MTDNTTDTLRRSMRTIVDMAPDAPELPAATTRNPSGIRRPILAVSSAFAAVLLVIGVATLVLTQGTSEGPDVAATPPQSSATVAEGGVVLGHDEQAALTVECLLEAELDVLQEGSAITYNNREVDPAEFNETLEQCEQRLIDQGYVLSGDPFIVENTQVPDLIYLTVIEARGMLAGTDLTLAGQEGAVLGEGETIVDQSPEPGTVAPAGSVVQVTTLGAPDTTEAGIQPTGDAKAELASHQRQWEATGPSNYRYVIQADCECNLGGHLEVQVEADEVTSLIRLDVSGQPAIDPEVGATIDDLFALIEEGFAVAESVDVEYDDRLGYPIRIHIVWEADTTDGAIDASITEFETLE